MARTNPTTHTKLQELEERINYYESYIENLSEKYEMLKKLVELQSHNTESTNLMLKMMMQQSVNLEQKKYDVTRQHGVIHEAAHDAAAHGVAAHGVAAHDAAAHDLVQEHSKQEDLKQMKVPKVFPHRRTLT